LKKALAWLDQNEQITPINADYLAAATIKPTARGQGSIVRATPKQTEEHTPYTYYFLWQGDRWTLLRRVPLNAE